MNEKECKSIAEALLFFWADPLDITSISEILEINIMECERIMDSLIEDYKSKNGGLIIKKYNKSYQMVTNDTFSSFINKLTVVDKERNLSNSLMETLSIIAYKQPITRVEIDSIRGVSSSASINSLQARGLIKELGKLNQPGRPIIYGTTDEFLRVFDLKSLDDMPELTISGDSEDETK